MTLTVLLDFAQYKLPDFDITKGFRNIIWLSVDAIITLHPT
jgi:hypothetical protein